MYTQPQPLGQKTVICLQSSDDLAKIRHVIRSCMTELHFDIIDQTKLITAAGEIARNTIEHGGGGELMIEALKQDSQHYLKLEFTDTGPGIPDIPLALEDGFGTGNGLGLGLGGARRLVDELSIENSPGGGTKVTVIKRRRFTEN